MGTRVLVLRRLYSHNLAGDFRQGQCVVSLRIEVVHGNTADFIKLCVFLPFLGLDPQSLDPLNFAESQFCVSLAIEIGHRLFRRERDG